MGKLFNLKEWLTLPDAARHLSIVFGEEVSEADVLRLALDQRLPLSVYFVNKANVCKGRLVPKADCPMYLMVNPSTHNPKYQGRHPIERLAENLREADIAGLAPELREDMRRLDVLLVLEGIQFRADEFLLLEGEVVSIEGVWDLAMVGSERLDVEHRYQMETGGPEVTLSGLNGAFVQRDGVICQLQEHLEDNEYQAGSKANRARVEAQIKESRLGEADAAKLREHYEASRREFLRRQKERPRSEQFYPAGGLPGDAVYVVRTAALRDFEQSVLDQGAAKEAVRPMSVKEDTTYLHIIGGLLGLLLGKTPAGKQQSVFQNQAKVIEALEANYPGRTGIKARTLEQKFAAAKRLLTS